MSSGVWRPAEEPCLHIVLICAASVDRAGRPGGGGGAGGQRGPAYGARLRRRPQRAVRIHSSTLSLLRT